MESLNRHQAQLQRRLTELRAKVLYAADQVNLATYHKRPEREIANLLEVLRLLTLQAPLQDEVEYYQV